MEKLLKLIRRFAKERDWEQFHSPKNLAMAMSVEAGEVSEIFQWLTEEQSRSLSGSKREALADELADVFIYLLKIADQYDVDLVKAAFAKMSKNAKKYPVSKTRGIAKKYTELS